MKRIRFSITYPERLRHPLHRQVVAEPSVSRAELLSWSPTADATTLLWCDGDPAATESVVAAVESVTASHLVAGGGGTYAFLRQADYEFADEILSVVADAAVVFDPPVVFDDTGTVTFEAVGEAEALGAFHDALVELGDLTIDRVEPFERAADPSHLTERQAAALRAAVAAGYYEVPRRGTIADVAAALDCATSTAGELVRKAEAAVVRAHLDGRPERRDRG